MIVSIKTQSGKQKKELKELLRDLKSKTRYTYPEIIIQALRMLKSGLNTKQGETIKRLQDNLHEKNIALDAMGFVWCDGGCEGGIYRYNDKELTEELLIKAENNVKRMRTWFNNYQYSKQSVLSK